MNESITLFLEVGEIESTLRILKSTLEMFYNAEFKSCSIELILGDVNISNYFISEIKKIKTEFSKIKFLFVFSCREKHLRKINIREFEKNNFVISLIIDDVQQLQTVKRKKKVLSDVIFETKSDNFEFFLLNNCEDVPIKLNSLSDINDDEFEKWLLSKESANISNFADLIKTVLSKKRIGCEYNSCMGRVLSINSVGEIFWCKHNNPETKLCQISDFQNFSDVLDNGLFEKCLDNHLQKREHCKSECNHYNICQGGCPLRCNGVQCTEQEYIKAIGVASDKLQQVVSLRDLSLLNNHAKAILLDSVARTPFSDFFIKLNQSEKCVEDAKALKIKL
jgi:radical SAM protein with 4Fe4S-binding SPASM domain